MTGRGGEHAVTFLQHIRAARSTCSAAAGIHMQEDAFHGERTGAVRNKGFIMRKSIRKGQDIVD